MARPRSVEEALLKLNLPGVEGEEAYDFLYHDGTPFIARYVRKFGCSVQDAEDIPQKVFANILRRRLKLKFLTKAEWYGYLSKSAKNAVYDLPDELDTEPPEIRDPYDPRAKIVDIVIEKGLYSLADDVWLGPEPEGFPAKCLAAKLLLVDRIPVEDVISIVAVGSGQAKFSREKDLWRWLGDIRVVRQAAFDNLNVTNDELVAALLGVDCVDLDNVRDEVLGGGGCTSFNLTWSGVEVQVILLRYRHGLSLHHIGPRCKPKLEMAQISSVCQKCVRAFPFEKKMEGIWRRMEGSSQLRSKAFSENPLWKRLVFQFSFSYDLSQSDIVERLAPAANVVGYRLKNINSWVAERLGGDLIKYAKKVGI